MEYVAPATIGDAVQQASQSEGSVRFLSGGTDVLVQLRSGLHKPDLMIDIKKIPGMLDVTRSADGAWKIGAAVPGIELGAIETLRSDWPGVVECNGVDWIDTDSGQGQSRWKSLQRITGGGQRAGSGRGGSDSCRSPVLTALAKRRSRTYR